MRIFGTRNLAVLAITVLAAVLPVVSAHATPTPNGATIETRTFNDCPLSTVTTSNNYPASIQITDAMSPLCVGFANLHSWSFSADGGATAAVFNNNSDFRFGADFMIAGSGEGEGGLRISPWYGKFVDGRMMANATTGEIACFGGALPFYSFTVNHGITYTRGTTIHMEATYRARDLFSTDPASIQYRVVYNGNTYDSPELPFGQQNPNECNPNGLWGMLNDGRVGGYFQPRADTGASLTGTWSNITFGKLTPVGTPVADAATIETRTFNDCPLSTVSTSNNYPASIQITDVMSPLCVGFANLHSWSFSDDGGTTAAVFNNNSVFKFGADFTIAGPGEGEGGLRISPWYGKFVDGRFMANATTGEIACFGGALPFYSFTVNHGITYTRGTTIHLEATYKAHELVSTDPATIQYRVVYNGNTYDSPVLPFGEQNPNECTPNGLWGMLNDGRVGGYFQPRADTGASLTATWGNITYSACPVEVAFTFNPHVVNLNSHGKYVTGILEPPAGLSVNDIDVSTIRLNGSVAVAAGAPTSIGDADGDGVPDLTVKFLRAQVAALLDTGNEVAVTVTGLIGADCFSGTDTIRVTGSHAPTLTSPAAGSVLASGSQAEVRWAVEPRFRTVDLIATFDDGVTWNVAARGLSNSGTALWTVPATATDKARVAVVVINSADDDGIITEAEFGESGLFGIAAPTDIGSVPMAFALKGVWPNPTRQDLSVTFSLPNDTPATLAVYDVAGRKVAVNEVGGLGRGLHTVTLATKKLPAGVFIVRLTRGGQTYTTRAIVLK
jgi:hypothetical protein